MSQLRVATRGSPLARWQAEHVAELLRRHHPGVEVELVVVETMGDRVRDRPISEIGGQGVFVKEVQAVVIEGRADVAVHAAKDLPSSPDLQPGELVIAAIPERGDPRDALVGLALDDIPPGGTVATGSTRRRAVLADLRPDLTFAELRGNMHTRLAKAAGYASAVVAVAPLQRLALTDHVAEVLAAEVMLPQIGQGALAVECRADDDAARSLLGPLDHGPSRRAVSAERGYLASLGGGCELPAAAYATVAGDGSFRLRTLLATLDGRIVLRHEVAGTPTDDPDAVGLAAGTTVLDEGGGRSLLAP